MSFVAIAFNFGCNTYIYTYRRKYRVRAIWCSLLLKPLMSLLLVLAQQVNHRRGLLLRCYNLLLHC